MLMPPPNKLELCFILVVLKFFFFFKVRNLIFAWGVEVSEQNSSAATHAAWSCLYLHQTATAIVPAGDKRPPWSGAGQFPRRPLSWSTLLSALHVTHVPSRLLAKDQRHGFFSFMGVLPARKQVCALLACLLPIDARRGPQVPGNWGYRRLWDVMETLRATLRPPGTKVSALNCWAFCTAARLTECLMTTPVPTIPLEPFVPHTWVIWNNTLTSRKTSTGCPKSFLLPQETLLRPETKSRWTDSAVMPRGENLVKQNILDSKYGKNCWFLSRRNVSVVKYTDCSSGGLGSVPSTYMLANNHL